MSSHRLDKEHCDRHFVEVGQNREALSAKLIYPHRDSLSLPPACAPKQGCHANPWRMIRDWDPVALVQGVGESASPLSSTQAPCHTSLMKEPS